MVTYVVALDEKCSYLIDKVPLIEKRMLLFYLKRHLNFGGVQCLSGIVLDSRPRGGGFEPHRCHCVVVLEQDTFILA